MFPKIKQMLQMPPEGHLDAPETTIKRKEIIRSKPFLYNFYRDCYSFFKEYSENIPTGAKLEIGTGAGFLSEIIPGLIGSDILSLPDLDLVCSGQQLPFSNNSLSAIYMLNVLHHIQDSVLFFEEVQRCLKPGGVLVAVEPTSSPWGDFIYKHFHNEPFDKNQNDWKLPAGGPLSMANGALPWIIFNRDKNLFKKIFPELTIGHIDCFSPFTYLLSGGFSYKQFFPGSFYPLLKLSETILRPFNRRIGMFMRVMLFSSKR